MTTLFKLARDALTGFEGRAVDLDPATGRLFLPGAGQRAIGILKEGAAAGSLAAAVVGGGWDCLSGAAVSAGDPLTPDSIGRLVKATAGDQILGVALDSAGAANETIGIELLHLANRFGNDYKSATSEGVSTTTSVTFVTKASLVTPAATGLYLVNWSAILSQLEKEQVQARLFNATDAVVLDGPYDTSKGAEPSLERVGSFREIVLAGTTKTLEIQFRSVVVGKQAHLEQARIRIWRVGA